MIHSSINICNEIEYLTKRYEMLLESDSYFNLNKNKDVIAILNVNFRPLKAIFNKYGIKRELIDPSEISAEKFFNLVSDIANLCKYDLVKLSKDDVKTEHNIDIFEFLRKIVAMSINLTEKPEENVEDYGTEEKKDLEFVGLKPEQAVEKFVETVVAKFREKERLEKEKEAKEAKEAKMNKAK